MINEMPLQREVIEQNSNRSTPGLLDTNEMHPDCFRTQNQGSNYNTESFGGEIGRSSNYKICEQNCYKQNEPTFGESFGKNESISERSQDQQKLRSYNSKRSLNSQK